MSSAGTAAADATQTAGATGAQTGQATGGAATQTKTGAQTAQQTTGDKTATSAQQTGTQTAAQTKTDGASLLDGGIQADLKKTEDGADKNARAAAAATWPEDWREQMAGGDEAALKLLKRYASPATFAKASAGLRSRLDSGEFKKPLAADATEDEVAKWRKDNGIPDKPEGYEMPKGLQIGDDDKPIVDSFLQFAHAGNKAPADVQATLDWFFKAREEQGAAQFDRDRTQAEQNEEILRAEYGNEFRGNLNAIKGFMQNTFGNDLMTAMLGARTKDGTLIGSSPEFFKAMAQLSREINPAATVTLPAGTYGGKGVDARIAELEGLMHKDIAAWQSTSNKAAQDELMELYSARERIVAREGGKKAA